MVGIKWSVHKIFKISHWYLIDIRISLPKQKKRLYIEHHFALNLSRKYPFIHINPLFKPINSLEGKHVYLSMPGPFCALKQGSVP